MVAFSATLLIRVNINKRGTKLVEVTDLALGVLNEALKAGNVAAEKGLCIRRRRGVLVLDLKEPGPADRVLSWNGRVIYMVGPEDEAEIGYGFIDVCNTDEGLQLVFRKAGLQDEIEKANQIDDHLITLNKSCTDRDCSGCGRYS